MNKQPALHPEAPKVDVEVASSLELEEQEVGRSNVNDEVTQHIPQARRILLLARGGPLLVDVSLTVDGRPIDEGIDALVTTVLKAGDTDEDGRSTWAEWRSNQEFLLGELANMDSIRQRTLKNWVETYDENGDGRMQRVEAAAWLGRDGGQSAKALRIRSSRSYLGQGSSRSRLWRILDEGNDGTLENEELELVTERLLLLDTNDDRIIDQAELATLRDQLSGQTGMQSRYETQSRRDAAVPIRTPREASDLDYVLSDLYAPRQQIGPNSFTNRASLFRALDGDGDQSLGKHELAKLATIEPHVQLAIEFSAKGEAKKKSTTIKIIGQTSEITHVLQTNENRIVLESEDGRYIVSARDLANSAESSQSVAANQISLMVHDRGDALFECLDADASGQLSEREITTASARIRQTDINSDGELVGSELPYSMTIAFMRGEDQSERSYYVPRIESQPVGEIDKPRWFDDADLNRDGDISRLEFLGSPAQFETLDANHDHFISVGEAAISAGSEGESSP